MVRIGKEHPVTRQDKIKKILKYLFLASFIGLLALLSFSGRHIFLNSDRDEMPRPGTSASPKEKQDNVELELTRLISKKDNKKYWELEAKSIKVNERTRKGEATGITCTFFDEKGKSAMKLKARGADIDLASMSLFFRGKVEATMESGDRMEVQRLVWNGKKKKLFGYESVKITKKAGILTGTDLIGDPSRKYVEILGHVNVLWHTLDETK
jgi:LPS export ABC transporter protein LptC